MKKVIIALKEVRSKCTDTVDEGTLQDLDICIQNLEKKLSVTEKQRWLIRAVQLYQLCKFLAGYFDDN